MEHSVWAFQLPTPNSNQYQPEQKGPQPIRNVSQAARPVSQPPRAVKALPIDANA